MGHLGAVFESGLGGAESGDCERVVSQRSALTASRHAPSRAMIENGRGHQRTCRGQLWTSERQASNIRRRLTIWAAVYLAGPAFQRIIRSPNRCLTGPQRLASECHEQSGDAVPQPEERNGHPNLRGLVGRAAVLTMRKHRRPQTPRSSGVDRRHPTRADARRAWQSCAGLHSRT